MITWTMWLAVAIGAPSSSGGSPWSEPLPEGALVRYGTAVLADAPQRFASANGEVYSVDTTGIVSWNPDAGLPVARIVRWPYFHAEWLFVTADRFVVVDLAEVRSYTRDGELISEYHNPEGGFIDDAALSPDGRRVALARCALDDESIGPAVVIVQAGQVVDSTDVPRGSDGSRCASAVAWHPDGALWVSDDRGHLRRWTPGHDLGPPTRIGDYNHNILLTDDGGTMILSGLHNPIHELDVSTSRATRSYGWLDPHDVAISDDGRWLAGIGGEGGRLWDRSTGEPRRQITGSKVAFGAGRLWTIGDRGPTSFPLTHPHAEVTLDRHWDRITRIEPGPTATTLTVSTWNSSAVWEKRTGRLLRWVDPSNGDGVYSADRQVHAVPRERGVEVSLTSVDEPPKFVPTAAHFSPRSLALSDDGQQLAVLEEQLWIHDLRTSERVALDGHSYTQLDWRADTLAIATQDGVMVYDGDKLRRIGPDEPPSHVAVSPDGQLIAASGFETAMVMDLHGRVGMIVPVRESVVAFDTDGLSWFTGESTGLVTRWEVR